MSVGAANRPDPRVNARPAASQGVPNYGSRLSNGQAHDAGTASSERRLPAQRDTPANRDARHEVLAEINYVFSPNPGPAPPPRVPAQAWWNEQNGTQPPDHFVRNPHATPRAADLVPALPTNGQIPPPHELREVPSASVERTTRSRANRIIRALVWQTVTDTVLRLVATQWVINRIEAISEPRHNEMTFNLFMRHHRPDTQQLASCVFSQAEKAMIQLSFWETVCPYTEERLCRADLELFGHYLRNFNQLRLIVGLHAAAYLPEMPNYREEALKACAKLLNFMYDYYPARLLTTSLFDGFEYEPEGGWILGDEDKENVDPIGDLRPMILEAVCSATPIDDDSDEESLVEEVFIEEGYGQEALSEQAPSEQPSSEEDSEEDENRNYVLSINVAPAVPVDYDPRLPNHGDGFLSDGEEERADDDDDYLYMAGRTRDS